MLSFVVWPFEMGFIDLRKLNLLSLFILRAYTCCWFQARYKTDLLASYKYEAQTRLATFQVVHDLNVYLELMVLVGMWDL